MGCPLNMTFLFNQGLVFLSLNNYTFTSGVTSFIIAISPHQDGPVRLPPRPPAPPTPPPTTLPTYSASRPSPMWYSNTCLLVATKTSVSDDAAKSTMPSLMPYRRWYRPSRASIQLLSSTSPRRLSDSRPCTTGRLRPAVEDVSHSSLRGGDIGLMLLDGSCHTHAHN